MNVPSYPSFLRTREPTTQSPSSFPRTREPTKRAPRSHTGRLTIRAFLFVLTAIIILVACGDPEPAAEHWPPAPRPTPTPGATLALPTPEPSALADEAYAVLNTLTTQYSPRESGTDQELEAALYLQKNLDSLGYDTSLQKFNTPQIFTPDLHLTTGEGKPLMDTEESHLHPMPVVLPVTPQADGSVTGLLTYVGDALQEDISDDGLGGRIPLIDLGTTTFREQIDRVAEAGAPGAIVASPEMDNVLIPFNYRPSIPVMWLSSVEASAVLRLIEQGEVLATIAANKRDAADSQNVVADMRKSANGPARRVILGAHYDTVEDTQGASDNGSGLSALLTVARHVAGRDYSFDVRIVLFGTEEYGLFGSEYYVENMSHEEIDGTIAMLNFDALGSGTTLHAIGDYDLTSKAREIGRDIGAPILLQGGGWAMSDHAPFEEVGIPALFLSSSDVSRINAPEDTIEHINPDLLGYAAEVGIAMLDWLAEVE